MTCQKNDYADKTPPSVLIISPADGDSLCDEVVISVLAEDNIEISHVKFFIDGTLFLHGIDMLPPFNYSWNTTDLEDSAFYSIFTVAEDGEENTDTSETISCFVNNAGRPPLELTLAIPNSYITKHTIKLKWERCIDKDFKEYQVYRNTNYSIDSTAALILKTSNRNIISHIDDGLNLDSIMVSEWGLKEDTKYYYWVVVEDSMGMQSQSNVVYCDTKTVQPVLLKEYYKNELNSIQIEWYGSDEDVKYYRIDRSQFWGMADSLTDSINIVPPGATTFQDTGLIQNFTYYYKVIVFDSAGYSAESNKITAKTNKFEAVELFAPCGDKITKTSIQLRWSKTKMPGETIYSIYRSEDDTVTLKDSLISVLENKSDTVYLDTELSKGKEYNYRVYLSDENGNAIFSNELSISTIPMESVMFYVSQTEKYSAELMWGKYPSTDFQSYVLYHSKRKNFIPTDEDMVTIISDINTFQYTDSDLNLRTKYYYKLYVEDGLGNRAINELSLRTKGIQPVTLLQVIRVENQYNQITYTMNRRDEDFTHYEIYKNDSSPNIDKEDNLIVSKSARNDTVYRDLTDNFSAYYRIYVIDNRGNSCNGSNANGDPNNSPPSPIDLFIEESTSQSISLGWSYNGDDDFLQYEIYRGSESDFNKDSEGALRIAEIYEQNILSYTDQNLNSGFVYYYRIYVKDIGGNYSESNVVNGCTNP